jgi:hypothetical protein
MDFNFFKMSAKQQVDKSLKTDDLSDFTGDQLINFHCLGCFMIVVGITVF